MTPEFGETRAWHRLTPAEQATLTASGRRRTWQPGATIAVQGAPADSMFVILRGWVKITVTNDRGDNAPIAARGPGEIVGELAPISGRPRTATIQAITEVEALAVPTQRLRSVLAQRPHISEELFRAAAIRLEQSAHLHLEAGGPAFPQRLAAILLELARQYAPAAPDDARIDLPFTQEDLASIARVSRSTLLRGLDELRRQGVAETVRRATIVRTDVLRNFLAGRS